MTWLKVSKDQNRCKFCFSGFWNQDLASMKFLSNCLTEITKLSPSSWKLFLHSVNGARGGSRTVPLLDEIDEKTLTYGWENIDVWIDKESYLGNAIKGLEHDILDTTSFQLTLVFSLVDASRNSEKIALQIRTRRSRDINSFPMINNENSNVITPHNGGRERNVL